MSSRQILKWMLMTVVATSSVMMSSGTAPAAGTKAIEAKDIVVKENLMLELQLLADKLFIEDSQNASSGKSIKAIKIFTKPNGGSKQFEKVTDFDLVKDTDWIAYVNEALKLLLLPEIAIKLFDGTIKDNASANKYGFKDYSTVKEIKNLNDLETFLKTPDNLLFYKLDKQAGSAEALQKVNADLDLSEFTIFKDLKIDFLIAESFSSGDLQAMKLPLANLYAAVEAYLTKTIQLTDFSKKDLNINKRRIDLKKQKLYATTDKFYTEADYNAKAGASTTTEIQQAGNFEITKVTKPEQVEALINENTKNAIKKELENEDFKKKDSELSPALKDRKAALQRAYNLQSLTTMEKATLPLIAALVALLAGFTAGRMTASSGNPETNTDTESALPANAKLVDVNS